MRTYLFVQEDAGKRAGCIGVTGPLGEVPWTRCPAGLKVGNAEYGLTTVQQKAVESAIRWWLVECWDSEHGQCLVEYNRTQDIGWKLDAEILYGPAGGILAIGGRS